MFTELQEAFLYVATQIVLYLFVIAIVLALIIAVFIPIMRITRR